MKTGNCQRQSQAGFALLENMISVLLLSIGAIGIALSTASTIKINVDNLQRSIALNAASTALGALYVAAETDQGAALRTGISPFLDSGLSVTSNPDESDADRDTFVVRVVEAVDAAGTNVLTTGAPYISPVTVAVQVDYQGVGGRNVTGVNEVKTAIASFTYVLKAL